MTSASLEHAIMVVVEDADPEEAMACLAACRARLIYRHTQAGITRQIHDVGGEPDRLLTVKEAASYLSVSEKTIRARQEKLGATRIGSSIRIPLSRLKHATKYGLGGV